MTGVRDITQLCFSSNLTGIVADKIEQSFYSVYSYFGLESIETAPKQYSPFSPLEGNLTSIIFPPPSSTL